MKVKIDNEKKEKVSNCLYNLLDIKKYEDLIMEKYSSLVKPFDN